MACADRTQCPWIGDCFCERDAAMCWCDHPNGSHGYGWDLPEIIGVSRIGLGGCGGIVPNDLFLNWPYEDCDCKKFTPITEIGRRLTQPFELAA